MALRQILSNLNVAVVSPFGALSLFADFENMSEFKPGEYHNESIESTIDQVVLWAKAMKLFVNYHIEKPDYGQVFYFVRYYR